MLSVVGKLYGRVFIKRVRAGTECAIGEEVPLYALYKGSVVYAVQDQV